MGYSKLFTKKILAVLLFCLVQTGFVTATIAQTTFDAAGCPTNPSPTLTGNQTVTCNAPGTIVTQAILTTQNNSSASFNNENITITSGTTIQLNGSTIGLASSSTVNNYGTLNVINNFTFGYGISMGANGRSTSGGNTVNNYGTISTTGAGGAGIKIDASNASALGNTITNSGNITTSGNMTGSNEANGILLISGSTNTSVINTVTNSGTITTSGTQAIGIHVESAKSTTSITNSGTIRTTGASATGLWAQNTSNVLTINNSGTISTSGSAANGIYVVGAAAITNSGMVCPGTVSNGVCTASGTGYGIGLENNANTNRSSITNNAGGSIISSTTAIWSSQQPGVDIYNSGTISGTNSAINFVSSTSGGSSNSVTLYRGSVTSGAINFNTGSTQETLNFNGFVNNSFSNAITGLNIINATNSAQIVMNSSAGYALVSGVVNVDASSSLKISGTIQDQTTPVAAATSVDKIGAGTLTLSGSNTYTGGTTLDAGMIAISNNAALGTGNISMANNTSLQALGNIALANAMTLSGTSNIDTNGNPVSLNGVISGTGGFNKIGAGTLTITNTNPYTGNTNLMSGTLLLTGSTASNTTVNSGTTLQGSGTINGSLTNYGTLQPSYTGNKTNFTVAGNYNSTGGVFVSNLYAPDTAITADTLTISGAGKTATGNTRIGLNNMQLLGKPTVGDGILLVNTTNGATTAANAFYYPARIAVGAYEYRLVQGGTNAPGNWYLKADNAATVQIVAAYGNQPVTSYDTQQASASASTTSAQYVPIITNPAADPITPQSSQRLEVANYPAISSLARLYAMNTVDSYDQRRGDLTQLNRAGNETNQSAAWGRFLGKADELRSNNRDLGPGLNARTYAVQLGADLYRHFSENGQTVIGPFMTLGQANGNTYNSTGTTGTGNVQMQAYSLGFNATHIAPNGVYVDTVIQASRYTGAQANSMLGTSINTMGWGATASLEGGIKLHATEKVSITPQAQLTVNNNRFNDAQDTYSKIDMPSDTSLIGRVGVKIAYDTTTASGPTTSAWMRVSGLSTLAGKNGQMNFQSTYTPDTTAFNAQAPANWMAIDAGLNVKITKDSQLSLNLGYDTSLTSAYQGVYGRIGLQVAF
jgi:outer membrane autotransporter protein